MSGRDQSLKCEIKDGLLIMSIGVNLIAHATNLNPHLQGYDEDRGEHVEPRVTDIDKFAREVLGMLKVESEDGTTLIHEAIDQAVVNAIEYGAEGIEMPDDIISARQPASDRAKAKGE